MDESPECLIPLHELAGRGKVDVQTTSLVCLDIEERQAPLGEGKGVPGPFSSHFIRARRTVWLRRRWVQGKCLVVELLYERGVRHNCLMRGCGSGPDRQCELVGLSGCERSSSRYLCKQLVELVAQGIRTAARLMCAVERDGLAGRVDEGGNVLLGRVKDECLGGNARCGALVAVGEQRERQNGVVEALCGLG